MMLLLFLACGRDPTVTLVNESPWTLTGGAVIVGPDKLWFGDLAPGARVEVPLDPKQDAGFIVVGTLDGQLLSGREVGYTTPGDGTSHVLTLGTDRQVREQ